MQTAVSILVIFLAMFVLWANPSDKFNKWCFIGLIIIFLGVFCSALIYEIFPTFDIQYAEELFLSLNSFSLWMMIAFIMPTWTIAGFYFGYVRYKSSWLCKNWETIKYLLYIPGLALVFVFSPLKILEYRDINISFWITYTVYNLSFGVVLVIAVIMGVIYEGRLSKEKSMLKKNRNRRLQEAIVLLPPVLASLLSIFPVRLFIFLGLEQFNFLHNLWQMNFIAISLCLIIAAYFAVNGEGFLGIRIIPARYSFILTNDAFMTNFAHRMKSQTGLMLYDIEQIRKSLHSGKDLATIDCEIENYLEKLLRKVKNINNISSKINRYSSVILFHQLDIENWALVDLVNEALVIDTDIKISMNIDKGVHLSCEKALMIEVFKDIIDNAVQSIQAKLSSENGEIIITGAREGGKCVIRFDDIGVGIAPNRVHAIFNPGESTKNKDYNSGMGLANCKKIVNAHGGEISAYSRGVGMGASIVIKLP